MTPNYSGPRGRMGKPVNGKIQMATSATQLPSVACGLVKFQNPTSNTGNIHIGGAGVTALSGSSTDTTTGYVLTPGSDSGLLPVDSGNLNQFYMIGANTTDVLNYIAFAAA